MTYDNLVLGLFLQFFIAPIGAFVLFICVVNIFNKYSLPDLLVNILMNTFIFTFPLSWIVSFIMIAYTHLPDNDTYNNLWHIFPFAIVFICSILAWINIRLIRSYVQH